MDDINVQLQSVKLKITKGAQLGLIRYVASDPPDRFALTLD